jgi:hypothetical protein
MLYAALSARSAARDAFNDFVQFAFEHRDRVAGGCLSLMIRCLRIGSFLWQAHNMDAGWIVSVLSRRDDRGSGIWDGRAGPPYLDQFTARPVIDRAAAP